MENGLLQINTVFVLRIILPFLQLGEHRWQVVVGPRVPGEGVDQRFVSSAPCEGIFLRFLCTVVFFSVASTLREINSHSFIVSAQNNKIPANQHRNLPPSRRR